MSSFLIAFAGEGEREREKKRKGSSVITRFGTVPRLASYQLQVQKTLLRAHRITIFRE